MGVGGVKIMQNKQTIWMENQLKEYKQNLAKCKNIHIHINCLTDKIQDLEKEKDELYITQFLKVSHWSDMPGTPFDGYKENKLFMLNKNDPNYQEIEETIVTLQEQSIRLKRIKYLVESIENALSILLVSEHNFISDLCFLGLPSNELMKKYNFNNRTSLWKYKLKILSKLYGVLEDISAEFPVK